MRKSWRSTAPIPYAFNRQTRIELMIGVPFILASVWVASMLFKIVSQSGFSFIFWGLILMFLVFFFGGVFAGFLRPGGEKDFQGRIILLLPNVFFWQREEIYTNFFGKMNHTSPYRCIMNCWEASIFHAEHMSMPVWINYSARERSMPMRQMKQVK